MMWFISSALAAQAIDGVPAMSWLTYPWVIGVSTAGGFVSFMQKHKNGKVRAFNFTEFIGEVVTSGFVGVVTFWLCKYSNFSEYLTAALCAVTGHMGSRAIFIAEMTFEKWFPQHVGVKLDEKHDK